MTDYITKKGVCGHTCIDQYTCEQCNKMFDWPEDAMSCCKTTAVQTWFCTTCKKIMETDKNG